MSDVDLVCPHCGITEEHDLCEKNEQDGEYEIQCSSCENYFDVTNVWVREVSVNNVCERCDMHHCKCV